MARFLSYPSPKSQEDVIKLSPSRGKPRSKPKDSSDLQTIPGIGPSLAVDLLDLGYRQVSDLRAENPEAMYRKLCRLRGTHQDRCVLYVFRCAVYYASRKRHHPERLKWWNWSDEKMARRSVR